MQRIDPPSSPLNPIAELRLRRWARENYVPEPERRSSSWHPVVLDEMRRKDEELRQRQAEALLTSTFVPLAPGPLWFYDRAHGAVPSANVNWHSTAGGVSEYIHG